MAYRTQELRNFYAGHCNEDGTNSPDWDRYAEAMIAAGCLNFDCWQQAEMMMRHRSPNEAAIEIAAEDNSQEPADFEFILDHDHSMNG